MDIFEHPGNLGPTRGTLLTVHHANWPAYPEGDDFRTALLQLTAFPPGTQFHVVEDQLPVVLNGVAPETRNDCKRSHQAPRCQSGDECERRRQSLCWEIRCGNHTSYKTLQENQGTRRATSQQSTRRSTVFPEGIPGVATGSGISLGIDIKPDGGALRNPGTENLGTLRIDARHLLVSRDVRRHRLISMSYITALHCHGRGREFECRRPRHSFLRSYPT